MCIATIVITMVETDKLIPLIGGYISTVIKTDKITTEDWTLPLHYRVTPIVLITLSILVTCEQFFGEPINCIKSGNIDEKVINTFCWIEGTFTLPRALYMSAGDEVAAPGVDQLAEDDEVVKHRYYQWVWVVLLVQAILFALPKLMWKSFENNRLANIVQELHAPCLGVSKRAEAQFMLTEYLINSRPLNNEYALWYMLCQLLALCNVMMQLVAVGMLLHQQLGWLTVTSFLDVVDCIVNNVRGVDSRLLESIFPKLTKCTFYRFGSSGDVQRYDQMCLLPINVVNEKIFVALTIWLIILATLTTLQLTYKLLVLFTPLRYQYCRSQFRHLATRGRKLCSYRGQLHSCDVIAKHCSFGDIFLLEKLASNINLVNFGDVFVQFANHVRTRVK